MKKVFAIPPFRYRDALNFKMQPYDAWLRIGGSVSNEHYPWRGFRRLAFKYNIPTFWNSKHIAELRFVQPISINFDTFPGYIYNEIIPVIWDCWPSIFQKTCQWLKKHHVQTAVFTASQTADCMKKQFPDMDILAITEGIDVDRFDEGLVLTERIIALYEIGSVQRGMFRKKYPKDYKSLFNKPEEWSIRTHEEYKRVLQNSQLTVIFPRSITEPEAAQGVETLTQRYWECMLSRILMIGHAPQELTELIGYNPVIEMDINHGLEQVESILSDISNPKYQELVNHNRETALRMGSWDIRMKQVMEWLRGIGYDV
jgi:hypothetical protein